MIKILIILMILANIYDIKYKIIPDYISLLILLVGFLYREVYFSGILLSCIILGICLIVDERYKGGGDIKLIGAMGLVVGFVDIFTIYIVSEILVNFFRILYKKIQKEEILEISYAPFLLISSILIL